MALQTLRKLAGCTLKGLHCILNPQTPSSEHNLVPEVKAIQSLARERYQFAAPGDGQKCGELDPKPQTLGLLTSNPQPLSARTFFRSSLVQLRWRPIVRTQRRYCLLRPCLLWRLKVQAWDSKFRVRGSGFRFRAQEKGSAGLEFGA